MARPDPLLEALWQRVLDGWEDEPVHAAFLQHCQNTDQLAEAATRYRGMAGDRERGESAGKRLHGVTILAMAKLEASRAGRSRHGRGRSLLWAAVVVAAALTWLAVLHLFR